LVIGRWGGDWKRGFNLVYGANKFALPKWLFKYNPLSPND